MIGETVDKYRIVRQLGEGGMGSVYLAEHSLIRRRAAVKMLLPALSQNQDIVQRFFNEAVAASGIRHPGIVEIYDFGYHSDGAAFIVMELLDGEGLEERIRRLGRLPTDRALAISRQICSALSAAHEQGIVHRDLKPDNVFLVRDPDMPGGERIKLLDFGIAKLVAEGAGASRTRTGAVMGTPSYMSPEQCRGASDIDHRTDLYAVGCILYHALCGRPPFVSEYVGDILAMHMRDEPEPPSAHAPELSSSIDQLVLGLLAKSPADRPATARELATTLDAMMGAPARAPSVTGPGAATISAELAAATPPPSYPPPAARTPAPENTPVPVSGTMPLPTPAAPTAPSDSTAAGGSGSSKKLPLMVGGLTAVAGVAVAVVLATGGGGGDDGSVSAAPAPALTETAGDEPAATPSPATTAASQPDAAPAPIAAPAAADLSRYVDDIEGEGDLIATLETSMGTLACKLYEDEAPMTVANFVGLARGIHPWTDPDTGARREGVPLYDGTRFHRVVAKFMIQGGDPLGTGRGGPGYTFADENTDAEIAAGTLFMANAGPGTNGSQFGIMAAARKLGGKHTVFGRCDDAELVEKMSKTDADKATGRPDKDLTLSKVTLARGSWKAKVPAKSKRPAKVAGGTRTPKVRTGATSVSGRLPPEIIQRVVRHNFGRFRYCYEKGLMTNPKLAGKVNVRFVIGRDGKVANVSGSGSLPDSTVISCITKSFYGLTFPRPEGGIVTVSYPFVFAPG